jgi:hypothetical protein
MVNPVFKDGYKIIYHYHIRMDYLTSLLEKKNMSELILAILFIIYLVMGKRTPDMVAKMVDNMFGKAVIILVALYLFAYHNPILGVLGLFVAYQLVNMSLHDFDLYEGISDLSSYMPKEEKVWSPYSPAHQFSYTLEQEIVKKMASQRFNTNYVKAPYRPSLDDTHNASPL